MTTTSENLINDLNDINLQIAHLNKLKDAVVWRIVDTFGLATYHEENNKKVISDVAHEGEHTQIVGKFKVKFKTLVDWKIDIEEYLIKQPQLTEGFNVVKAEVKYTVSKTKLAELYKYGSDTDISIAQTFLEKRFANPSITITANA